MITIDRNSSVPIFEQLVKQLRYLIAIGHFDPRRNLPSTRALASSLGISFHTVRKAYQVLERQGVLRAATGSGYRVQDPFPMNRSDRIERGAAILAESLQQLVGLGLSESEIEYLVDEQLGLVETRSSSTAVAFYSNSAEVAEQCASAIGRVLQQHVDAVAGRGSAESPDPEYVITEFRELSEVRTLFPESEIVGVSTHLSPRALDSISRLLGSETLGLLTRDVDTIRYLSDRIKRESGFVGQIMATSSSDTGLDLTEFFRGISLLAYTEPTSRRVRGLLPSTTASVPVSVVIDHDSLTGVLDALPA